MNVGTDAYISVATADAYHVSVGNAAWAASTTPNKEAAIIRATAWIDAQFGTRFAGRKAQGRIQLLAWPRGWAMDSEGYPIAGDSIPAEVQNATAEAALRELASPGSLSPDLERGGAIKSVQAGSVAVEYMAGASAKTTFTKIEGLLGPVLATGSASGLCGKSVRG